MLLSAQNRLSDFLNQWIRPLRFNTSINFYWDLAFFFFFKGICLTSLHLYSGKLRKQKEKHVQILALGVVRLTKAGRVHGQVVIGLPWREYSVKRKAWDCWDLTCRCGCDQPVGQRALGGLEQSPRTWKSVEAAYFLGDEKFPRSGEPYVTVGLGFRTVSLERMWELDRSNKSLEA